MLLLRFLLLLMVLLVVLLMVLGFLLLILLLLLCLLLGLRQRLRTFLRGLRTLRYCALLGLLPSLSSPSTFCKIITAIRDHPCWEQARTIGRDADNFQPGTLSLPDPKGVWRHR